MRYLKNFGKVAASDISGTTAATVKILKSNSVFSHKELSFSERSVRADSDVTRSIVFGLPEYEFLPSDNVS